MKTLLTTTTAEDSLGPPPMRRLLTVQSGAYAGRKGALLQTSAHELYLVWADAPFKDWSTSVLVTDELADLGFDAVMTDAGDIHIVYPQQATGYIRSIKLSFIGGEWTIGSPVTAYNVAAATTPTIACDNSGALWVAFVKIDGIFRYLHAKRSLDGGATWGSGPSDEGTTLTGGVSQACPKLVRGATMTFLVYTEAGSDVNMRTCPSGSDTWSAVSSVVSDPVVDEQFDAAVSGGGMLGVVFDSGDLRYREFNGVNWSAIAIIDEDGGEFPQLVFEGEVPVVFYLSPFATNQTLVKYGNRRTGVFGAPEVVDPQTGLIDSVILYHSASASYANLTTEAGDDTTGDVVHPDSWALVSQAGDAVYLGRNDRFRLARIVLSTAGSGGAVALSYFDGSQWQVLTPVTGDCELNASDELVVLFEDDADIPVDWQRTTVNGQFRYWVRVLVTAPFTTAPVGSRITAIGDVLAIQVGR